MATRERYNIYRDAYSELDAEDNPVDIEKEYVEQFDVVSGTVQQTLGGRCQELGYLSNYNYTYSAKLVDTVIIPE